MIAQLDPFKIIGLSLVALLAACTSAVNIEQPESSARGMTAQIENRIGFYNDEYLKNYVDAVGRRLLAELDDSSYTFRFYLIDAAEPNLFATAAGYVYLSRGMLALTNSEAELAGILAHGIAHVIRRHDGQPLARDLLPGSLRVPGRMLGPIVNEDIARLIGQPAAEAGRLDLSRYSREQEAEADREGMRLAARAGYDPAGLHAVLRNLQAASAAMAGVNGQTGFFDLHPQTSMRLAGIQRDAATIQYRPARSFANGPAAFLDYLDGLWWGSGNPAQGIFDGPRFVQPDLNISIGFPEGWETVNTPRFVGAFAPDRRGFVVLGTAGPPADPAALAASFVARVRQQAAIGPDQEQTVELGEWPGYLLRIGAPDADPALEVFCLWARAPRLSYRLIGAAPLEYRDELRATALSLRELTGAEAQAVAGYRIRIAMATQGETLAELATRSANGWTLALTAAHNGLEQDTRLVAGQPVKVLAEEPYLR